MPDLNAIAATHPQATLVALGGVWLLGYLIACAVFPYKVCRVCTGSKKMRSGKAFRACWRCRGSGRRRRLGALLLRRP